MCRTRSDLFTLEIFYDGSISYQPAPPMTFDRPAEPTSSPRTSPVAKDSLTGRAPNSGLTEAGAQRRPWIPRWISNLHGTLRQRNLFRPLVVIAAAATI